MDYDLWAPIYLFTAVLHMDYDPNILCSLIILNPEVLALRTVDAEAVLLQVAATTKKIPNSRIPNYPSLPSQLLCQVHNITLHVSVNDTSSVPNVW